MNKTLFLAVFTFIKPRKIKLFRVSHLFDIRGLNDFRYNKP